ncbi:MAG: zf-HC2 domain-containing protein [Acidimicrobiales bacterium]
MSPLTCQAAVRAASDQLAGQLSDAERGALEEHLGGCDSCSCLMDQLYSTIAILRSRPEVQVPDWLAAMVAHTGRGRAEALTAQLPHLYALANALDADAADDLVQETLTSALADADAADDLVQETLTSALADPDADTTGAGLAGALTRLAVDRGPEVQSPAVPTPGSDPDADEPELFYPGLYADAPDAGAWVDQPVAWGEARVLGPEDDLVTTETYAAVDAGLADLDPIDAGLVTLVDIEGAPLNRAALELDLSSAEARERLARARFAVRAALDRYLRSSTPTTRTASLTRPSEKERSP